MLLDVNEENGDVIAEFIDFANRKLHHVIVDLTDCESTAKAVELVRKKLSSGKYNFKDLVKIELTGKISEEAEINEEYILHVFKEDFYFLKVKNSVKVNVDYRKYANDESLKGWFIRLVENSEELDEEMKGQVVQMGLRALSHFKGIIIFILSKYTAYFISFTLNLKAHSSPICAFIPGTIFLPFFILKTLSFLIL